MLTTVDAFSRLHTCTCTEIHVIQETAVYTGDGTGGVAIQHPTSIPFLFAKIDIKLAFKMVAEIFL